jgi:hypothetical protein
MDFDGVDSVIARGAGDGETRRWFGSCTQSERRRRYRSPTHHRYLAFRVVIRGRNSRYRRWTDSDPTTAGDDEVSKLEVQ